MNAWSVETASLFLALHKYVFTEELSSTGFAPTTATDNSLLSVSHNAASVRVICHRLRIAGAD